MIITSPVQIQPMQSGTHGNAWLNVAVPANGISNIVDVRYQTVLTIFGNSNGNSNLLAQVSQDGTNFYTMNTTAISNGNFGVTVYTGARFIRLQSSAARTITATIAGK